MVAKRFFYVCTGIFLVIAAYQLGALKAEAQGQELQVGNTFPAACGVSGRTLYVMRRDGSNQPIAFPDPIPGASDVVGVWAQTSGGVDANASVVLANGDILEGFYGHGWTVTGNLFSSLPTPSAKDTWGGLKARYHR